MEASMREGMLDRARRNRRATAVPRQWAAEVQRLEKRELLAAVFVTKSVADHSIYDLDKSFLQTFAIKNTDTVSWSGYRLVRVSASDKLGVTTDSVPFPTTPPGQTASVTIFHVASKTSRGAAQVAYWELRNGAGATIPISYGFTPVNPLARGKLWTAVTINPNVAGPDIPRLRNSAYTSSSLNPYVSIGNGGQCTAFAYGRALEQLGLRLALGNGAAPGQWIGLLTKQGLATDMVPKANSIAVWVKPGTSQGHVAYVESVSGSGGTAQVTINEANVGGFPDFAGNNDPMSDNNQSVPNWGAGYDGAPKTLTHAGMVNRGGSFGTFMGYIHLR